MFIVLFALGKGDKRRALHSLVAQYSGRTPSYWNRSNLSKTCAHVQCINWNKICSLFFRVLDVIRAIDHRFIGKRRTGIHSGSTVERQYANKAVRCITCVLPALGINRTYQVPLHTYSASNWTQFVLCPSGFSVSSVSSIIVSSATRAPAYTAAQQSSATTPTKQSAAPPDASQPSETQTAAIKATRTQAGAPSSIFEGTTAEPTEPKEPSTAEPSSSPAAQPSQEVREAIV